MMILQHLIIDRLYKNTFFMTLSKSDFDVKKERSAEHLLSKTRFIITQ